MLPKKIMHIPTQNSHHGFDDKELLFSLMTQYYSDLYKYGLKFTADAALTKELINKFFLHVWDHRDKFLQATQTKSYLIVSFKRLLIQQLRQQKIFVSDEHLDDVLIEQPYETYIIAAQQSTALKSKLAKVISALPKRQKQLLQMRFYEQMSYEEIAKATSLSTRTVYNKLHEAIKKLRESKSLQHFYEQLYCITCFLLSLLAQQ